MTIEELEHRLRTKKGSVWNCVIDFYCIDVIWPNWIRKGKIQNNGIFKFHEMLPLYYSCVSVYFLILDRIEP